jgi:CBS domain-containing protein
LGPGHCGAPIAYPWHMATGACGNPAIPIQDSLLVRDVMVRRPKTLPAGATVGDLRRLFSNAHVMTALLVDGDSFAGAVDRHSVPDQAPDDSPARSLATSGDVIGPDLPMAEAVLQLEARGTDRLVVLDGPNLVGLVCLTKDRDGFCRGSSSPL